MKIREIMLPVLKPLGGEEEVSALREVIESGWWGKGPKVAEFEEKFAKMVGHKYAVAVTSASHGQDLVMKAKGFKGIDVVNPTMSFIATAVIPLWNDCSSNIVDVQEWDLNIDPQDVKARLKRNSDCLIAVNMAGVPAPIDEIREFYDGYIIEDTAHSCYTEGAGLKGDVAVWSFQAVKTMPCGDGGMITTDDYDLYCKVKDMTWFGVSSTWSRAQGQSGKPGYSWDYQVDILGYKCYMIDIMAAICLEQMKKLPAHLERRRLIQSQYNERLNERIKRPPYSDTVQYYIARVPEYKSYAPDGSGGISASRDGLIDYLADKKIHTSVHFKPLHKYGILRQTNYREYPVADNIWESLISLPCHPAMTDEDIEYVIYWVNQYFEE
jgi:perosamine synthetase